MVLRIIISPKRIHGKPQMTLLSCGKSRNISFIIRLKTIFVVVVRRLSSSSINVTISDGVFQGRKVMDIRLRLSDATVNIRYGVTAANERARVLGHVTRDLNRRVWSREQDIVSGAVPGGWSAAWRDREIKQILGGHSVDGWDLEYRHSPDQYPELAADIVNVKMVRANRKRSRH